MHVRLFNKVASAQSGFARRNGTDHLASRLDRAGILMSGSRRLKRTRRHIRIRVFFERRTCIPTAMFMLTWVGFAALMLVGTDRWTQFAQVIKGRILGLI